MIVGRESEVGDVGRFLLGSEARALLLEGPAGVGKTTIWRAGVEEAARLRASGPRTRPLETETSGRSFSGLTDLVGSLFDAHGDTPAAAAARCPRGRAAQDARRALRRPVPSRPGPSGCSGSPRRRRRSFSRSTICSGWTNPQRPRCVSRFAGAMGTAVRLLATVRTGTRGVAVVDDGAERIGYRTAGVARRWRASSRRSSDIRCRGPRCSASSACAGGNAFIALKLARAEAGRGAGGRRPPIRRGQTSRRRSARRLPAATQTGPSRPSRRSRGRGPTAIAAGRRRPCRSSTRRFEGRCSRREW